MQAPLDTQFSNNSQSSAGETSIHLSRFILQKRSDQTRVIWITKWVFVVELAHEMLKNRDIHPPSTLDKPSVGAKSIPHLTKKYALRDTRFPRSCWKVLESKWMWTQFEMIFRACEGSLDPLLAGYNIDLAGADKPILRNWFSKMERSCWWRWHRFGSFSVSLSMAPNAFVNWSQFGVLLR